MMSVTPTNHNSGWELLEAQAEIARLKNELAQAQQRTRIAVATAQTMTSVAEKYRVENESLKSPLTHWEVKIEPAITLADYQKLLQANWTIVHRQFEGVRLGVVAERRIKPPTSNGASKSSARVIGATRRDTGELNARIFDKMRETFFANGGGQPPRNIEEMIP